ncbi:heparan-alpha-glucosaminide N-acetyltransferase domain-containing protein [Rothia halotolerans]|uniref:heparan-alpha-glucosaminide N-acetyltransferase domain-containing protein n=1 Tax=Rothia halotolerans TaxID=405770 RepID=UPI00101E0E5E|nr:heparan-alpha-glucosaminide N-acetyltransferase domain-containing protein [Rothia halotolerans]
MSEKPSTEEEATGKAPLAPARSHRLVGIDAARGLALIGMVAIHILPSWSDQTGRPTVTWLLFSGNAAALFALLAGVGLALMSGGRRPHKGRRMLADRVGLAVRAVLIALLGLCVSAVMPADPPAYSILVYYGAFFLLAIPFLKARPLTLFVWAGILCVAVPVLMQSLREELPDWTVYNPTFSDVFEAPAATLSQLLLTGTYPALAYLVFVLAGLGLGRLNLRETTNQVRILVAGVVIALLARLGSHILLYGMGGFEQLYLTSPFGRGQLRDALIWGPDFIPTNSAWWYAIATPHTEMPLAIASSLGISLAALGAFLLVGNRIAEWLRPLSAMGAMTLTLYTAHLLALSAEVHYELPYLWFLIQIGVAVAFALVWQRWLGKGPLERGIGAAVTGTRRVVMGRTRRHGGPGEMREG